MNLEPLFVFPTSHFLIEKNKIDRQKPPLELHNLESNIFLFFLSFFRDLFFYFEGSIGFGDIPLAPNF